ncbi:hypothetical protein CGC48_09875 [Capnocytophaga cynodegmi]|uniref:Lipoprotein n=1 Tax=Capnocytophaga cynodegmi TaxID=28189 RepID=A0A250EAZ4_9FLAO|nr:hypothetical protein [Capnocytophaga cynodegmi]ATA68897.1 hypothetical protein CGC48_09875 [Capnocytophaga cynodegmi]
MKKKNYFGLLFIFTVLLVGCKDNDDVKESNVVAMPNASSFQNLRETALNKLTQTKEFEVDGMGDIEFTSEKGVKVRIPEGCLVIKGKPVQGKVKFDFIELFDKSSLLTTNIATMGWDSNEKVAKFLVTGGAFNLKLTQNGQEIELVNRCTYNLEVPAKFTGGAKQEMILWYGNFNDRGDLVWEEAVNEMFQDPEAGEGIIDGPVDGISIYNDVYYGVVSKFGWVNYDYFYGDNRERTTLTIKVPAEYDYKNSSVYVSYKDVPGLARSLYDETKKTYVDSLLPIGLDVHVIFASESNGKWAYAIKSAKITKDHQVEFLKSELKEATQAEFEAVIKAIK